MRKNLAQIDKQRMTFTGIFARYGTKTNYHGYPEKTILLKDIRNGNNRILTDHIWFRLTKGFERLGELHEGEIIQFDARVKAYTKGYVNHRQYIDWRTTDYKLSHPTKIRRLAISETEVGK